MPNTPSKHADGATTTTSPRSSPRLDAARAADTAPDCHNPTFIDLLKAANNHGPPSFCTPAPSANDVSADEYSKLDESSWQKGFYQINDDRASITNMGLVRLDHLVIGVAHAVQPNNKNIAGTKMSRYEAVGQRVTGILKDLRYTAFVGGATRGKTAVRKKLGNPSGSSWESIVWAIANNLCPVRDPEEETGGGTDNTDTTNHSELQPDKMIEKMIGDLRAWSIAPTKEAKDGKATDLQERLKRVQDGVQGGDGFGDYDDSDDEEAKMKKKRRTSGNVSNFSGGIADMGAAELIEAQLKRDSADADRSLREREIALREKALSGQLRMQEAMLQAFLRGPAAAAAAANHQPAATAADRQPAAAASPASPRF
jgi:hypothetical protein